MSCFGRRRRNRVGNTGVCVLNSFLSLSRLDIFSVSAEFCIPHRWKQTQPTLLFVLVLCLFNHYFFEPSFCFYASAGLLCKQIYSWFFRCFWNPQKSRKISFIDSGALSIHLRITWAAIQARCPWNKTRSNVIVCIFDISCHIPLIGWLTYIIKIHQCSTDTSMEVRQYTHPKWSHTCGII